MGVTSGSTLHQHHTMLSTSNAAFRLPRCSRASRPTTVRVVASGFGKPQPQKAKPEPEAKAVPLPASVDPKKGWRAIGDQAQLFELKPVKGVEAPGKAVAVYLHKDKVYCR